MPQLAEQVEKTPLLARYGRISTEGAVEVSVAHHGHGITLPGSFHATLTAGKVKIISLPTTPFGLPSVGNTAPAGVSTGYLVGASQIAAQNLRQYLGNVAYQQGRLELDLGIAVHRVQPEVPFNTLVGSVTARQQTPEAVPTPEVKEIIPKKNSTEAERRLGKHNRLLGSLISAIETEALKRHIAITKLTVHPAWSHEYEENSGIVINTEIKGNAEERFALWDAVSEKTEKLQAFFDPEDGKFL